MKAQGAGFQGGRRVWSASSWKQIHARVAATRLEASQLLVRQREDRRFVALLKMPAAGRSSPQQGSTDQRWYAWVLLTTASPRHHLLIRRHLASGELAFHYCYAPRASR